MVNQAGLGNNVLITGTPRSGTTLTCHLLNKLPDTVALHEPMRVKAFESLSRDEICEEIRRFCDEQRSSLRLHQRAISKNVGGVVPDNPFGEGRSADGLRKRLASKGEIVVDKPLSPDFMLVIKHNSAFMAVLETLATRFPIYGVIRNPLATLASWNSVEISASSGYARAAERLDPDLKARLAVIHDDLDRQICLLDWFHGQIRRHLPDNAILRYESVVATGGRVLSKVNPHAEHLRGPMESRNTNKLYDVAAMRKIGERLLATDGAFWEWYTRDSVVALLDELDPVPIG
jgi:hypothetical protein